MGPQALGDTIPASERDNRLSAHIARAREQAERARAERARSDVRRRFGGASVAVEEPDVPDEPATPDEDQAS